MIVVLAFTSQYDSIHDFRQNPNFEGVNNSIPVIAAFDRHGKIKPLYIGMLLSDGTRESIQIDKVLWQEQQYANMIVYQCLITILDKQAEIRIGYDTSAHIWRFMSQKNESK